MSVRAPAKGDGRWLVLALIGLAAAFLLAAGALLVLHSGAGRQEPLPYILHADDKSLGINIDLSRMDPEARESTLSALDQAGFKWLRQRFAWNRIEPELGVLDWAVYDAIVEEVGRHHLKLIAVLDGAPAWAQNDSDRGNPLAPPAESRDFGDWAEALAARYGSSIDVYQVWDEPNIAPHWGAQEISPGAYGHLLREGAIRIRAGDPGAVILLAALAPNVEGGGANLSELDFLEELYQWGGAEWFDGVAVQPYPFDQPIRSIAYQADLNWKRVELVREVMIRHGDTQKALWAVAFGSGGDSLEVPALVEVARADWPWLGPMLWAAWSPNDPHGEYALTDSEGKTGPVWEQLRTSVDSTFVAWPGTYRADHVSGQYEGDWRITPVGADIGSSGDWLAISFVGTRLDLQVRRGEYRAFLKVTIDGQPANMLPHDLDGQAYIVLYDPSGQVASVTVAQGLRDGEHRAEIVADRGWGQWALIGWSVLRETQRKGLWPAGLFGLLAFVVLIGTCLATWPRRGLIANAMDRINDSYRRLDGRLTLLITGGAALLTYASAGLIPTLAALLVLGALLFLRPEMGLPLVGLALPFYQPGVALFGKVFSLVEILTVLTVLGWLASRGWAWARDRNRKWPRFASWSQLDWGVLALVAVGALSLLWTEYGREAAREFRTVVLEAGLYYALLRLMVRSRQDLWRVVDAWALGAGLVALLGLGQWISGSDVISADGVSRVRGLYGSPNNLALYLGRLLPVTLSLAVFSDGHAGGGSQPARRWAYGLAGLIIVVALLLTYSRGAWLLGIPAAVLFVAAMRGRKALASAAIGLAAVAILGVLLVGHGRLTSLFDTSEGTTFFRLQLWQSSWAMICDHPLLGVGLDNFLYAYRSHYVLPAAWEEFNLSHPHNLVFDFWLRLGVPGLLVGGWLLISFARSGWQTVQRLADGAERALALGLMGSCVYMVAHGLVDHSFFLVDLAFTFMLMAALVQVVAALSSAGATTAQGGVSSGYW